MGGACHFFFRVDYNGAWLFENRAVLFHKFVRSPVMSKIENEHLWCPIDFVIHIIGSRWTIAIVRELATGVKRPSELTKTLVGISAKTLTQRLRELEQWGLVQRDAYQEIPPRVEYSLTSRGQDLVFILEALRDLGESWQRSMNIEIPPPIKEQCSHCFDYLRPSSGGDGDGKAQGSTLQSGSLRRL